MKRRVLLGLPLLAIARPSPAAGGIAVACAANLRSVFPRLVQAWLDAGGEPVKISYGASGIFTRQIRQGAPFALFLSADQRYAESLVDAGLTRGPARPWAAGSCALLVHKRAGLSGEEAVATALADVAARAGERFSIANPEHAPYGQAARDILEHQGLWTTVGGVALHAENAAQATRYVDEGQALAGIVPGSLAMASQARGNTRYWLLPAGWHRPVTQTLVVLMAAPPTADALADWLQGPVAGDILEASGYAAVPTRSGH